VQSPRDGRTDSAIGSGQEHPSPVRDLHLAGW
jgi:hypothetical protein